MPLRHQNIVPLCRICGDEATARCDRCGTPLCAEHAPAAPVRRCDRCEAQFLDESDSLMRVARGEVSRSTILPSIASGVALLALLFALVHAGASGALWLVPLIGAAIAGVVFFLARIERQPQRARRKLRRARRGFLDRRALPPADDEIE